LNQGKKILDPSSCLAAHLAVDEGLGRMSYLIEKLSDFLFVDLLGFLLGNHRVDVGPHNHNEVEGLFFA